MLHASQCLCYFSVQVTRRITVSVQSTLTLGLETVNGLQFLRVIGALYSSCVNSEHILLFLLLAEQMYCNRYRKFALRDLALPD